jgi:hypothetical protein
MYIPPQILLDAGRLEIFEMRPTPVRSNNYVKTNKGYYPDDYGSLKQVPFLHTPVAQAL